MRARPKAWIITFGKTVLTVSPEAFDSLGGWGRRSKTYDAFSELRDKHKLSIERVVGNRKFELSPKAAVAEFRKKLLALNPAAKARTDAKAKASNKRYAAYARKSEANRKKLERARLGKERAFLKEHPLPAGLLPGDIVEPKYEDRANDELLGKAIRGHWSSGADRFDLWYTERFGWIVPTLKIRDVPGYRARRQVPDGTVRRSYAVALRDGSLVRAGMGPHVLKALTVYLQKGNRKRLAQIIAKIHGGAIKASECRDELSTRRATGRRFGSFRYIPGGL